MKASPELSNYVSAYSKWNKLTPMKKHNLTVALGLTKDNGSLKYSLNKTQKIIFEYLFNNVA